MGDRSQGPGLVFAQLQQLFPGGIAELEAELLLAGAVVVAFGVGLV